MCSLFTIAIPRNQLQTHFRLDSLPDDFADRDIRPTDLAPVVRIVKGHRLAVLARWGLSPSWAKDESIAQHTFNACSETLAEKASFRAAFKRHRCIVPATAFYEWRVVPGQKKKQRLRFEAYDGRPLG